MSFAYTDSTFFPELACKSFPEKLVSVFFSELEDFLECLIYLAHTDSAFSKIEKRKAQKPFKTKGRFGGTSLVKNQLARFLQRKIRGF